MNTRNGRKVLFNIPPGLEVMLQTYATRHGIRSLDAALEKAVTEGLQADERERDWSARLARAKLTLTYRDRYGRFIKEERVTAGETEPCNP